MRVVRRRIAFVLRYRKNRSPSTQVDWLSTITSNSRMRKMKARFLTILDGMQPPPQIPAALMSAPSPLPSLAAPPTTEEMLAAASHLSSCFAVSCDACARAASVTRTAKATATSLNGGGGGGADDADAPEHDDVESARERVLSSLHLLDLLFTSLASRGGEGGYSSSACASLARCALVCRDWAAAVASCNKAWHAATKSDFSTTYRAVWLGRMDKASAAARAAIDWRAALRQLMRPLFDPTQAPGARRCPRSPPTVSFWWRLCRGRMGCPHSRLRCLSCAATAPSPLAAP